MRPGNPTQQDRAKVAHTEYATYIVAENTGISRDQVRQQLRAFHEGKIDQATLKTNLEAQAGGPEAQARLKTFLESHNDNWVINYGGPYNKTDITASRPAIIAGEGLRGFAAEVAGNQMKGDALMRDVFSRTPAQLLEMRQAAQAGNLPAGWTAQHTVVMEAALRLFQMTWQASNQARGFVEARVDGIEAKAAANPKKSPINSRLGAGEAVSYNEMANKSAYEAGKDVALVVGYLRAEGIM